MIKPALSILATSAILLGLPASAQSTDQRFAKEVVQPLTETNKNRLGLSYRMGFNISAEFRTIGGYAALNPFNRNLPKHPLRTPDGAPYNYDNGFIYPDTTTANAHPGYTWNYGYVAGTPMRPENAPTDFDLYHASAPANLTSRDNQGDPQLGMEVTYSRQLGRVGKGFWGLEAAIGFTDISIEDSRTLRGTVVRATDTFRTGGGVVLKPAPFAGNTNGPVVGNPWPLVGLTPVDSSNDVFDDMATVRGHRKLDSQVVGVRLGPYLDIPMSKRWMFTLSGGLALAEVFDDFSFDETVTIDPSVTLVQLPAQRHQGSGSKSDPLVGGYIGGTFSYAFNDRFRLFAGAQFQSTGDFSHSESGNPRFQPAKQTAVIDLSEAVFVTLGATFSF